MSEREPALLGRRVTYYYSLPKTSCNHVVFGTREEGMGKGFRVLRFLFLTTHLLNRNCKYMNRIVALKRAVFLFGEY